MIYLPTELMVQEGNESNGNIVECDMCKSKFVIPDNLMDDYNKMISEAKPLCEFCFNGVMKIINDEENNKSQAVIDSALGN